MSWFNAKNKNKIVDTALGAVKGIGKFIDEQKLTPEEAMKANISIADSIANFAKDTLAEKTERSMTRRKIAVFFIYFFCALVVLIVVIWKFDEEWAKFALELITSLNMAVAFMMVMAFFFGAHLIRQYQGQDRK